MSQWTEAPCRKRPRLKALSKIGLEFASQPFLNGSGILLWVFFFLIFIRLFFLAVLERILTSSFLSFAPLSSRDFGFLCDFCMFLLLALLLTFPPCGQS